MTNETTALQQLTLAAISPQQLLAGDAGSMHAVQLPRTDCCFQKPATTDKATAWQQ